MDQPTPKPDQQDEIQPEELKPPAQGEAAPDVVPAPVVEKPRKPSVIYRLLHFLFNPETRLGRFIRTSTRNLAFGVGMFALGMFITLLVIYRPAEGELAITRQNLQAANQTISDNEAKLLETQHQVSTLQAEYNRARADLDKVNARVYLQMMMNQVSIASNAIVARDGPAAQQALTNAKNNFKSLQALNISEVLTTAVAGQIDARLNLVNSELSSDPVTARSDLDLLSNTLSQLDKLLAEP
jgi:hypothetical protein